MTALAELEARASPHPWSATQMAEEVEGGRPRGVLVLEGPSRAREGRSRLRAYVAYRLVLDEVHVMNLAVAPEDRRRGLARWLLAFALRSAARAGARRALLEVREGNRAALGLYESLGFRRVGVRRGYYRQPEEDAILLNREGLRPDS